MFSNDIVTDTGVLAWAPLITTDPLSENIDNIESIEIQDTKGTVRYTISSLATTITVTDDNGITRKVYYWSDETNDNFGFNTNNGDTLQYTIKFNFTGNLIIPIIIPSVGADSDSPTIVGASNV